MYQKIKKYLLSIMPEKWADFLRKTKYNAYTLVALFKNNTNIRKNREKTRRKLRNNETIKVAFIAQYPEMWNSEKSLYESLTIDDRFETIIIAVPKYHNDHNDLLFQENEMLEFCLAMGLPAIDAGSPGHFIEIPENVDFVFRQRPYDLELPSCYSFESISNNSLVCYIPYSGRMTKKFHLFVEMNDMLMLYYYSIFADCDESYSYIDGWKETHWFTRRKKVYNIGYPRFDLMKTANFNTEPGMKTFLWLPRWSLRKESDLSHFLDYIDILLSYFEKHQELELIIRPHPLMFSHFIEMGAMTADEIATLKDRVSDMKNVSFEDEKDYISSFVKCDYLISDKTSLLLEFFFTGKPIIFCDSFKDDETTDMALCIFSTFYIVSNTQELITNIDSIAEGNDPMYFQRMEVIKNMHNNDGCAGKRIADRLIEDLYA